MSVIQNSNPFNLQFPNLNGERNALLMAGSVLTEIAKTLGFQNRFDYENAVQQLLRTDKESLQSIRGQFNGLTNQLNA